MALRDWLVPTATGIAGLIAGLLINGAPDSAGESGAPATVFSGTPTTTDGSSAVPVTLDDLRRVVREELAALPAGAAGRQDGAADGTVAAATPDQSLAADQARAVLEAAVSRRSWTDADRDALAPQFVAMSAEQRNEWMLQYAQAVNQGRLVPDSERPPF